IEFQQQSLVAPAIAEPSLAGLHTVLSGARSGHREIPTHRDARSVPNSGRCASKDRGIHWESLLGWTPVTSARLLATPAGIAARSRSFPKKTKAISGLGPPLEKA